MLGDSRSFYNLTYNKNQRRKIKESEDKVFYIITLPWFIKRDLIRSPLIKYTDSFFTKLFPYLVFSLAILPILKYRLNTSLLAITITLFLVAKISCFINFAISLKSFSISASKGIFLFAHSIFLCPLSAKFISRIMLINYNLPIIIFNKFVWDYCQQIKTRMNKTPAACVAAIPADKTPARCDGHVAPAGRTKHPPSADGTLFTKEGRGFCFPQWFLKGFYYKSNFIYGHCFNPILCPL